MRQTFLKGLLGLSAIATIAALPTLRNAPVQASLAKTNLIGANSPLVQKLAQAEVQLHLTVQKKTIQIDPNGQSQVEWQDLASQAVVQPGDVLRYRIISSNIGGAAAQNFVLNQPIPNQMRYLANSANSSAGLEVSYSIDGGERFSRQPVIQIEQPDGTTVEQPAPAKLYTHVRWEAQEVLPSGDLVAFFEVQVR